MSHKMYVDLKMNKEDYTYKEVSLFRNPIITLHTTLILISNQLLKLFKFLFLHKIILMLLVITIISSFFDGPHRLVIILFIFQFFY